MLTWNVTYHCKPGRRDDFYQALCDLGIRASSLKRSFISSVIKRLTATFFLYMLPPRRQYSTAFSFFGDLKGFI